jgi:hypothetical protein
MNVGGWIFMCVSWAAILTLVVYTLVRTLRSRDGEDDSGNK